MALRVFPMIMVIFKRIRIILQRMVIIYILHACSVIVHERTMPLLHVIGAYMFDVE